jgi:hypothetical protein
MIKIFKEGKTKISECYEDNVNDFIKYLDEQGTPYRLHVSNVAGSSGSGYVVVVVEYGVFGS